MQTIAFLGFFNILFYIGILIFGVYFVITTIKSMKQRNEYLKEIVEELRGINNSKDQQS